MSQRERIRDTMLPTSADLCLDGEGPWFTLRELCDITGISEACVSAQLRALRACGNIVTKRMRESGSDFIVWEYSLRPGPVDKTREYVERQSNYERTPVNREQQKFRMGKYRERQARKAEVA